MGKTRRKLKKLAQCVAIDFGAAGTMFSMLLRCIKAIEARMNAADEQALADKWLEMVKGGIIKPDMEQDLAGMRQKLNEQENLLANPLPEMAETAARFTQLKHAPSPVSPMGIYLGLCPFHADTKPNFEVRPHNQTFRCNICRIGGDVTDFLRIIEGRG
jgi:hypothetical protein